MSREWLDQALCVGMNPRDFDAEIGGVFKPDEVLAEAAKVCGNCNVYWECKAWADAEVQSSPECNIVAAGGLYARGHRRSIAFEAAS